MTLVSRATGLPLSGKAIRTPMLGFVELAPAELWILDQPPFQRLRRINQLGFSHYVYPGAQHTRFLHTLSVLEMGSRILRRMRDADATGTLGTAAVWEKRIELFRLSALFHDVGHPPFSHAGEAALPAGKTHEDFSIEVLSSYADFIDSRFSEVKAVEVAAVLDPRGATPIDPEMQVVYDLMSGEVDADKLSYLLDDSYFCGVNYGNYDSRRFIETSRAYRDSTSAVRQAVEWGGLHVAEEVIVARYKMLIQVYFHRTRRIYDLVLSNVLKHLLPSGLPSGLEDYLAWDDARVLVEARNCIASSEGGPSSLWAERLLNRHHLTPIFDPPTVNFDAQEAQRYIGAMLELERVLEDDGIEHYRDDASKLPHRLTASTAKGIVVLDERDDPQPLYSKSAIVRALTQEIHLFRIYACVKDEEEAATYRQIWQERHDREQVELKKLVVEGE
jgi:HD superfamily phosphohydrolase